ncbi:MAG TPA: cytochrome c peroxidase [Gammaproteobacteria bacterium]|nr:cytochrome c peroxidase [Gammaproteobacteria bacterium]
MTFIKIPLVVLLLLLPLCAVSAEDASLVLGKKLFSDRSLSHSTNAVSCQSCHAGGAKLEGAAANPDLAAQVNRCIVGALKGEPLPMDSVELRSLVMYVEQLSENASEK